MKGTKFYIKNMILTIFINTGILLKSSYIYLLRNYRYVSKNVAKIANIFKGNKG